MSYWDERLKKLKNDIEKDEEKLRKNLSAYYDKESAKIGKEIAAFYQMYSLDDVIEFNTLRQTAPANVVKLLYEDMDAFAQQYPQYAHLLPVRESAYKLDRLEALKQSLTVQQLKNGAYTNTEIEKHLIKQAEKGINSAAESLGLGKNFCAINTGVVDKFVKNAWANRASYSDSIWNNTIKLANYLNTDISQALARGDSYDRLIKNVQERFSKVSRKNAYRLIYTEGTYVMNESAMSVFENEFDSYKISTMDDGKVCSICKSLQDKTFKIEDREAGVNFPPLHPWCRCTFTIDVDDWDKWLDDYSNKQQTSL